MVKKMKERLLHRVGETKENAESNTRDEDKKLQKRKRVEASIANRTRTCVEVIFKSRQVRTPFLFTMTTAFEKGALIG